ncbi:conserved hypothetical protein [Theileria equi strain WA]|uniref:Citrate synthase n=1 Tax=Theileria equi strain WA TaxID=1537102 RepID=L1LCC6_THEEQ|nr:conserved hypothetical protein [Theileria equi strain WA]EKX72929.1 conserved hypothetical protein [Theileria equi strain WA]|eukprot:XP_004832381.1 conserved hypothetical protein [Theileria equi strain WA]
MYILKRAFSTVGQVIGKHKHKQLISVETEIYSPFINNDVHFRGYPLRMLASQHTFLEVFHLILNAKLPEKSELDDFVKHIHSGIVDYPYVLTENLKILPANIHITDMLISCFSLVNGFENRNYGSLFGQCLGIIYSWKIKKNKNPLCSNNPVADLASRLLFRKSIDDNIAKFINVLLVLSIDHGLTSASYAARICTSELGSAYSSLIAAASIHKTCLVQLDNYDEIINEGVAMLDSHKGYIHGSRIPNELKSVVTARKDPRVGILVVSLK